MSKVRSSGHCPVCGTDIICAECAELRSTIERVRKMVDTYADIPAEHCTPEEYSLRQIALEIRASTPATCKWTFDLDGFWRTECGQAWSFEHGDPDFNGVKFCQGCARRVETFIPKDEKEQ